MTGPGYLIDGGDGRRQGVLREVTETERRMEDVSRMYRDGRREATEIQQRKECGEVSRWTMPLKVLSSEF